MEGQDALSDERAINQHKRDRLLAWKNFLNECIHEQVIPKSFPRHVKSSEHPFPESARADLVEAIARNEDELSLIPDNDGSIPARLHKRNEAEAKKHQAHLRKKLSRLCEESRWHNVGREDIVTNISNVDLTRDQKSALSLGLKFSIGTTDRNTDHWLARNYRYQHTDIDNGFIQGVVFCLDSISRQQKTPILPRRFMEALKDLQNRDDVIITRHDKGGGVAIMSTPDYNRKMGELLSDTSSYQPIATGTISKETDEFNRKVKKILNRSEEGRKLKRLLEERPRAPRMRGLPKTHKKNIPMRPIISGIGAAPHRLAKLLAKPLSAKLGSISGAHLKNSTDLIEKLGTHSYRNKKLVSFDVTSLFTNVPVDEAMKVATETTKKCTSLPLPEEDFLEVLELCVKFNTFTFNDEEYRQTHGMAMGSPLSAVLCSLFMEDLERGPIKKIIGKDTPWYRYVDDTLVILRSRTNTKKILDDLNTVHPRIKFTMEEEVEESIPFLDTRVHRNNDGLKFSVYRKATHKDDYIHYLSGHSERTKRGVIIGFFIRALRISSQEFLATEIQHIFSSFRALMYPNSLLKRCYQSAKTIIGRKKK